VNAGQQFKNPLAQAKMRGSMIFFHHINHAEQRQKIK